MFIIIIPHDEKRIKLNLCLNDTPAIKSEYLLYVFTTVLKHFIITEFTPIYCWPVSLIEKRETFFGSDQLAYRKPNVTRTSTMTLLNQSE